MAKDKDGHGSEGYLGSKEHHGRWNVEAGKSWEKQVGSAYSEGADKMKQAAKDNPNMKRHYEKLASGLQKTADKYK